MPDFARHAFPPTLEIGMTTQFNARARLPGPLNISPWTTGGRYPGVLAFVPLVVATPLAAKVASAVKTLVG